MLNCSLITQSHTKKAAASALAEAKARHGWSNTDLGDALGCGEGTIRNRLDTDSPGNQMTVHELLRSIQSDGPAIANRILGEVGYRATPTQAAPDADVLLVASRAALCASELITAAPDGIDPKEAQHLLPLLVDHVAQLTALKETLRVIAQSAPRER